MAILIAVHDAMTRHPDLALGSGAVILLAVAAGLLLLALGWRVLQDLAVRRRIRQALSDPDPEVRCHGVGLAVDRGLGWSADLLLELARNEHDPAVLAALVRAVARRQWEPASTPRIVELRLWAKSYVDSHEELQPAAAEAQAQPTLADRPARRASDATEAELAAISTTTAEGAATTPAANGRAASNGGLRVLVTGAGGAAGVAVIRDLVAHGHHVVAVDCDESAVGFRLANEGYVVPRADDTEFVSELTKLATSNAAQALVCTVAEEYVALVPEQERLASAGLASLMPSAEVVATCIDKWRFARFAAERGLPAPATNLGAVAGIAGPPWIVKPRHGRGSRDVHVVADRRALAAALAATPEPIVQEMLGGREFTADALVDRDGSVVAVVPRWRLETKAGISTKGRTFDDAGVIATVERVLGELGLVGPANVQGFVADDGSVSVHEVNPRFSGGLPLSLYAGADLVEQYVRAIVGEPVRRDRLTARPDVVMYRHFAEVFEG